MLDSDQTIFVDSPANATYVQPQQASARVAANLAALELIIAGVRSPSAEERELLSSWSGWGAIPDVFKWGNETSQVARLKELLAGDGEWEAARASTLNAHYTPSRVAEVMWGILNGLGLDSGDVLEPGCGAGVFMEFAPPEVTVTGVELEPMTARIAQVLHPRHIVVNQGFERPLSNGQRVFDAAIGNVPFGNFKLVDPAFNRNGKMSIHDHFLYKTLSMLRPGGVAALITSRYTLDKQSPYARELMYKQADLLGAIRLPRGAFRENAGTEVVTDILVFRKRRSGEPLGSDVWVRSSLWPDRNGPEGWRPNYRNDVFDAEICEGAMVRGHLLGKEEAIPGMYRGDEYAVLPVDPLDPLKGLTEVCVELAERSCASNMSFSVDRSDEANLEEFRRIVDETSFGSYVIDSGLGQIFRVTDHARALAVDAKGVEMTPDRCPELVALIELRDATKNLLERQSDPSVGDTEIAELQVQLTKMYDSYVGRFGFINRVKVTHGAVDKETGLPKVRRSYPKLDGFRSDPDFWLVAALEDFDEESMQARKADIFTQRVINPHHGEISCNSAVDALAHSLDKTGGVDLDMMAKLCATSSGQVIEDLGDLVFFDPDVDCWVPRNQYLAGKVRDKLRSVEDAVKTGRLDLQRNVDALLEVQPVDLTPEEIDAKLGSSWIPEDAVSAFIAEVVFDNQYLAKRELSVSFVPALAQWTIDAPSALRSQPRIRARWATTRVDVVTMLGNTLNNKRVEVYDKVIAADGSERKVLNADETILAQSRVEAIQAAFREWVWADHQRSDALLDIYNTRFNNYRLEEWDGSHLTFPGMSPHWRMRPHQAAAVWRAVQAPSVGLGHIVGAGKTSVMVTIAMEERRLGRSTKPCVVVPNHLVEQWARDALHIYPSAKILVADRTLIGSAAGRKRFVALTATGDWDLVIMSESTFSKIPMRDSATAAYVQRMIETYIDAAGLIGQSRDTSPAAKRSVKKIESAIMRLRTRHEKLLNAEAKDDGVCWELTGIDRILVDEAHYFKNLGLPSNNDGIGRPSQRAEQLDLKIEWTRETYGLGPVFATGTPISNSIAEAYVMMHYLMPDRLEEVGLGRLDSWIGTFAEVVSKLELSPEGSSFRMNSRLARFRNVPELVRMFRECFDVQLDVKKLGLDLPDSNLDIVTVPTSTCVQEYIADLVRRAEAVRNRLVSPEEDNMLKVCGDGRKVSLDPALVDLPGEALKLDAAAERIASIYHAHESDVFESSETPGAFQLVFCDLGTPSTSGDTQTYGRLRDRIVRRGVPVDRIAFAQSAATDAAKGALHSKCRDGSVSVLIGSTATCGTGTNIQDRLAAIHHLDAPWKPAEVEQRNGRGLRQGNAYDKVQVVHYLTEGSFDAYLHQALERKAWFISQIMTSNDTSGRVVEDIGSDSVLTFEGLKAAATGDSRMVELAELDSEIAKLRRLRVAHVRETGRQESAIKHLQRAASELGGYAQYLEKTQERFATVDMEDFVASAVAAVVAKPTELPVGEVRPSMVGGRYVTVLGQYDAGRVVRLAPVLKRNVWVWCVQVPDFAHHHRHMFSCSLPTQVKSSDQVVNWLQKNLQGVLFDRLGDELTDVQRQIGAHDREVSGIEATLGDWPESSRLELLVTKADSLRADLEFELAEATPVAD